ncbi:major facilitator superfamily domain-containing protein [Colletotrichum phormii]|uniref:Major facilitator superfamily domain-containing protein n=1 Tax=Colletotrichum phormii TaxID=359342 RepID=A0AAJ0A4U0_9PEZI|nr:major facilitator superfamily domain-containing protein [Colletotrichum phormii]KAK1656502.1 major facilitator superfamily domain-containing protein [Colletotrichum phormii]
MTTDNSIHEQGDSSQRTSSDRRDDDIEEYADIIPARSKTAKGVDDPSQPGLTKLPSGVLNYQDDPVARHQSNVEVPYEIYNRFSKDRKRITVAIISWCGLLSPISSTAVLSALPEVAAEYKTSGDIISLSNALYLVFMAISPCFWGPLSQVYGRKWVSTYFIVLGCSIGTALSPNVPAFFVFRILTAFAGTSFLVTGPAVIGDLYHPTERATAMGWFLSGTLIGPTIGPVLGGIIVTYTSWRAIFWLQTALAGVGVGGAVLFMPETLQELKKAGLEGLAFSKKVSVLWGMTNPVRVIRLFRFPNLILVAIASGSLVWNMYGMLTPIRYVLNPRFSLTSPAQSGLFYLAPGCGYLAGTLVGGRYADYTVRRWIAERHGRRISEDRLRSCLPFLGAVLPGCMLIYGWTVQQRVGGIAVPVVFMFLGGVSQLFCFPSLNTYCLDVIQGRSAEVIAGNFMVRYLFGAAGSAVVLPAIKVIGVGWFSTISTGFLVIGALCVWAVALWGRSWRHRIDDKTRPSLP